MIFYRHLLTSQKDAQSSSVMFSIIVRAYSAPNVTKIGFTPYLALGEYDSLSRSMKAIPTFRFTEESIARATSDSGVIIAP